MPSGKLQGLLQTAAADLQAGRLDAAARLCARARAAAPGDFTILLLSGTVALRTERYYEAVGWLTRAAQLKPAAQGCARRLGFALAKLGRHDDAERILRRALDLDAADAESWDTLGFVLRAQGHAGEAIKAHRRAVELQPSRSTSWYNLGCALLFAGQPAEALECQDKALAADPGSGKAHYGRALALQQAHRIPEAIAAYDAALRVNPHQAEAQSYRLMALNFLAEPSREALFAAHREYGSMLNGTAKPIPRQAADRARLRVAFLSPDLRAHSVTHFLEPLLRHLDRSQFEIVLYHDHFVVDAVSERLKAGAELWRNFVGQPADAVEAGIRSDGPDILVDLAGHTGMNRLPLFARRLARVQISYLGYPNTTGLAAMDFRFVDAITDPVGDADLLHTEKLVRFAPTAWTYQPPAAADGLSPGIQDRSNPITFACFNNFSKITEDTLQAWQRLLALVPQARLRLKAGGLGDGAIAANARRRLERAGIELSRVELWSRTAGMEEHLSLYRDVDVALDTFPYNGTTTTCEALWMGVPVVTRIGDRHASRVGASLLTALGRPEWIARDWDDYVRIAADLTQVGPRGAAGGASLRQLFSRSLLCDHAGQAARFGAALHDCWEASGRQPANAS